MRDEIRDLLVEAETRLVDMYRAINPHASYESDYVDHRIENRMADSDPVVVRIRKALGEKVVA